MLGDFHALRDVTEDGVLMIQKMRIFQADVKLRAGGIRRFGACHRNRARIVLPVVELCLEMIAGSTGAGAMWAPTLDDKTRLDTMERQTIIKTAARQFDERRHGGGRIFRKKRKNDVTMLRYHTRLQRFGLGYEAYGFLRTRLLVCWHIARFGTAFPAPLYVIDTKHSCMIKSALVS